MEVRVVRNVRDFRNFVIQQAGVSTCDRFCKLSDAHRNFWLGLNYLWDPNKVSATSVNDVDAATPLTDEQWKGMEVRFRQIRRIKFQKYQ